MSRKHFLLVVFFLSGFCGLLYQVVWLRMAFAAFGIVTPVISVVVSVFMLGLSVGSWLGGRWVGPLAARSGRSAIVYYGGIECMIGLGAFIVPWLFSCGETALLRLGEADSVTYLLCSAAAIALSILPWCVFMGATFPSMMAFVRECEDRERTSFSFLYMANVLGAACGAALTAVALVEMLGFSGTLRLGAALNMGIAVACLLVGREYAGRQPCGATSPAPVPPPAPRPGAPATGLTVVILFVTGFASMAMEVVWTRAFTPIMTTTIYAFAALLATYLVATWLGSVRYREDLHRADTMPVGQLLGYLAASAFLPIVLNDPRFQPRPLVVCLSIAPLCGWLGYLTPHLIDEYSSGHPARAGKAYAVNILGCILGPLVAAYLMLPAIGVKGSLVLLGLPFVALFLLTFTSWAMDDVWRTLVAGAAALLLFVSIGWSKSLEEKDLDPKGQIRRDHTATVISTGEGMTRRLLINGVGITNLNPICKMMAHWPALHLPEQPKAFMVIAFGMGTTFRSAMSWGVDVYAAELVPSVRDAFGFYFDDAEALLKNPRAHVTIDDGRRFLKRTTQRFDIVTIDPPPPVEAAGSGLLYSEEFYDAVKARLNEHGIVQQWVLTSEEVTSMAAARSIARSFPYVRVFPSTEGLGVHFLASRNPIPIRTADELLVRMPEAARADLVEWSRGQEPRDILEAMLRQEQPLSGVLNPDERLYIADDRPVNEYYLLRRRLGYPPTSRLASGVAAIVVCGLIGALIAFRPRRPARTPAPAREAKWDSLWVVRKTELVFALALTVLIGVLHVYRATQAGPLWREEVATLALASAPSFSQLWSSLAYDGFPLLTFVVVRLWTAMGGFASVDGALRFVGGLIGVGVLVALWVSKRLLGYRVPLLSLVLFGLNAAVIPWGDSLRAYGLGSLLIVLVYGVVWKVLDSRARWPVVLAILLSVLSVQCIYENMLLLLAICCGGLLVTVHKRTVSGAVLMFEICLISALSLIPYAHIIATAQSMKSAARSSFDLAQFLMVFSVTLSSGSELVLWVSLLGGIVCIVGAGRLITRKRVRDTEDRRSRVDAAIFSLTVLVVGTGSLLLSVIRSGLNPEPWFYIVLIGPVALSLDVLSELMGTTTVTRIGRLAAALLVAAALLPITWKQVQVQQTNIDGVADVLRERADEADLVVVNPWFDGITFQRYYRSTAAWTTAPPIQDLRLVRYDLLKEQMAMADPLRPVFEAMTRTLSTGHRVWIVGELAVPGDGQPPPSLPPAPEGPGGWYSGDYLDAWTLQLGHFIATHAAQGGRVGVAVRRPVSAYEDVSLRVFQGWRP